MKYNRFRGTGVALVTPFKNKEIDFEALGKVLDHVILGGVEYVVSLGTTGESATLSTKEKHAVLDFTVKYVNKRVPIVAGFGGNDTRQIIHEMEAYHFRGIDAILSSSPSYNKPTQEGIYQHYMALAKAAPAPIIIYNVPGRTASNIEAETTLRLAHDSNRFVGIKEASGDLSQASKILKFKPKDFLVLSGDDPTALPLVSIGGDGVISVIGNALPELFSNMIRKGLSGNFKQAAIDHLAISDIHHWLYTEGNPAGIKAAMEMMGICGKETRLPLVPVSDSTYLSLREELEKINALTPNDAIA